ncbi:hypothetical protein BDL97_11G027700 [Sphagnum fallax]|nr:hypothetical protein BDL97_11G027700 [Sphagnum fallax]
MEICTKFELAPTFMHHVLLQPQQQSWLRPSHSTIQQPIALNPIAVSQRSRWSRSPRSCSLEAQGSSSSSSRRSSAAGVMKKATSSSSEQDPSSVSVIIPVFNEVGSIRTLVERVGAVMRRRGAPYEIICVDDGSTDGSTKLLKAMAAHREDTRVVILSRNFGQTAAMAAGFDFAVGQLLVTLDGDLQNDADDIPALLDHLIRGGREGDDEGSAIVAAAGVVDTGVVREDGGFDLVCGWRRNRKDNFLTRNLPSTVANWLIGNVTGVKLHDYGCSLKAYRASLISKLRLYGEMHRFIPVLAVMEGAAISEVEVQHHPRTSGTSKYGLSRIFRVLLDLTTVYFWLRFRDKPMHFMGFLGGVCILGSLLTGAFASWSLFTATQRTLGYSMAISNAAPSYVLSAQLLIMGLQLVCLGLLAEICVRFEPQQRRHPYRVREVATHQEQR